MAASYIARHGAMRFLGEFQAGEFAYARGQTVVVRTERGQELADLLCEASPQTVQMLSEPTKGEVLRTLTPDDREQAARLRQAEVEEFHTCNRFIGGRHLQMELVDVEHLFGGE